MLCAVINVTQMILVVKPSSSTTVGKLIYYRRKELVLKRCDRPLKDFGNELVLRRRWAPDTMTEVRLP